MLYSSPFVITLSTSRLKASSPISPQDVTHSKGWGVILTPAVISFLALFSWAVYCCFVADQHKWFSFFLLLPSASLLSLSTLSSSPPQHQLLSPFLSLSLQISSARKLLLLLQLAAARLHLLHVSAWALSLSLSPSLHTLSPCALPLSTQFTFTLLLLLLSIPSLWRHTEPIPRQVCARKESKFMCLCAAWVERVQQWCKYSKQKLRC